MSRTMYSTLNDRLRNTFAKDLYVRITTLSSVYQHVTKECEDESMLCLKFLELYLVTHVINNYKYQEHFSTCTLAWRRKNIYSFIYF